MKNILILMTIAATLICSCSTSKKANDMKQSKKVTVKKGIENIQHSVIRGQIVEASTGNKIGLSDIWVDNKKIQCDSNGVFQVKLNPGKHQLVARAMGFNNYSYKLTTKRGEVYNLVFFLDPYIYVD